MLWVWLYIGILQKIQQQCIQTDCDCDLFEAEGQTDEGDRICIDIVLVVQAKKWVSEWYLLIRWQNFLFLHLVRSPTTLDPISSLTLVNYLHHLGNSNTVSTHNCFFFFINKWRSSSGGRFASQDIRSSYLSNSSFQWAKSFRRHFSSEEALT